MRITRNTLIKQLTAMLALLTLTSSAWAFSYNNQHALQSLKYIAIITQDFCIVAGLGFMISGFFKMKKYGQMRTFMSHQLTLAKPLSKLIIGTALLCVPVLTNTILLAVWGNANPLPYPMSGNPYSDMIKPVIILIRLVGLFGLIRGIMLFSRTSGEQAPPGMIGKAVLHIIGGVMCLHIINTYNIIKYMLGFT